MDFFKKKNFVKNDNKKTASKSLQNNIHNKKKETEKKGFLNKIKSNKVSFQFIDNITQKINIDSETIKITVNVLLIIILLVIGYMFVLTYKQYKENIISIHNIDYNIDLLKNNYNLLKSKEKDISKLLIYKKSQKKGYSHLLYIIETIVKKSGHYIDNNFFISKYNYNKQNDTIKLSIEGVKYYNDIKTILFNLRRYNDFFIIKNTSIQFIEKKEGNKINNYYNINIEMKYINL